MTYSAKRWLSLYFALLLGLAILGSYNQQLYRTHRALIDHKEELILQRTELRSRAAKIEGAKYVRAWAELRGMVPVTSLVKAGTISEGGAPRIEYPSSGLELFTSWR